MAEPTEEEAPELELRPEPGPGSNPDRERAPTSGSGLRARLARLAIPAAIFAVTALVYVVVTGPRASAPSPNNHFAHLAQSFLNGQLGVMGDRPPGNNDWACYDTATDSVCPMHAFTVPRESYRWYVSFPPVPAIVLMPVVAIRGLDFSDPFVWALFAGLAPAFLFLLLRRLREEGISERMLRDDLFMVTVFALGSVYFSTAVQGSVWFSAHIVASALLVLFFYFAIGARSPLLAGIALGLCFWTRPTTAVFAIFFLFEAMHPTRGGSEPVGSALARLFSVDWRATLKRCAIFAAPILFVAAAAMWMNRARFGDPLEFGHAYLMIRWRPRIEKWGLFNFHYFAKNLSVYLAGLPWLSALPPYVTISRHGLALWVTSPNLLPLLWPKAVSPLLMRLALSTAIVAVLDLCYQNSGWVQFGYRFSLDYMPALILLLALSKRRFGWAWMTVLVVAIGINLFGALTFDRAAMFYDGDDSQERLFQPD